ncbi:MAG: SurA N-terminal domain-containing protein [Acidiferrobacterales bacterium]
MLSAIREKTQGIFAFIIVGLLIIPFAFWGVNEYFDTSTSSIIANVNGIEIEENAYRNAVDRYRGRVDPIILDSPLFKRQIAESLVQQVLLQEALESGGYVVGSQQLGVLIRNLPQFQIDGKFSDDRYRSTLRGRGQTVGQFESAMRQNKLLDQVIGSFKDSAIVNADDTRRILSLRTQTRRVETVTIQPRKFYSSIKLTESDIKQYYEQQQARYQEPERVRIAYIQLSSEELRRTFKPNEDDLKALYEEEKGRYTTTGSRRVSHILVELSLDADDTSQKKALALASEIATKAKSGKSFTALARKYSSDTTSAQQGGDLGDVTPGILPAALETVVNKMNLGEISDPVRSEFGYHIAKLTRLKKPVTKSYREVRGQLVKLLTDRKSEERFYDMAERFNNLVYEQSDSLEPAANELGLRIEKSGWFLRTGGLGITANPKVLQATFSADVRIEKRNSESIELSDQRLLALRIFDIKPARQKSITEVRGEIVAALKGQRAEARARELGRDIVLAARKGSSLASLAKKYGIKRTPARSLKREAKNIDKTLLSAIFVASRPQTKQKVIDGIDLGVNGYAVFALSRVSGGSPKSVASKERDAVAKQISERKGTGYYYNYLAGLRRSGKVKIFYDQL